MTMTARQKTLKRGFDIVVSGTSLLLLWPIILISWALAARDTGASGFFVQTRVGRDAKPISVIKLRTMRAEGGTTVTTAHDARITPLGAKFRRWKLDELPQLWNVLVGEMSLVGPRPDVPGFLDELQGEDRALLDLRPGITGPATVKYRDEETILAGVPDPESYNRDVIWPDKVAINLDYLRNWSFGTDLRILAQTVRG